MPPPSPPLSSGLALPPFDEAHTAKSRTNTRTENRITTAQKTSLLPGCEDFIERIACLIEAGQIPKSRDSESIQLNMQRPPDWLNRAVRVINSKLALRTNYASLQAVWYACIVDGLPPFLQDEDAIQAEINCRAFDDKSTSLDGCRLSDVLSRALGEVVPKIESGKERHSVYVHQDTMEKLAVVRNRLGCQQHTAASLAVMRSLSEQSAGAVINPEHRDYCQEQIQKYLVTMHDRKHMALSFTELLESSARVPILQDGRRRA